jgi:hypothetical protein
MSMTKPTAEQVTFKSQGLGAITRTLQDKLSETISVKDFGAVGDGVADDTAAIQAAIDYAMYRNQSLPTFTPVVSSVFMPTGKYRITNTIHLGYGVLFASVHLRGDGRRYRGEDWRFGGTAIIADFNDRPAIAIQGGRDNSVQALTIRGKNFDWVFNNKLATFGETPLVDDLIEANWVDPSFPASASSRYAPYCAIAIDPYSGPRPAVSYPDVNYPSWSGFTTQYNRAPSSDITLRDIEIAGFVVGVAIQPCDFDTTGDFVKIDTAGFEACQYAVSIGNSQSRDVLMDNCKCQFNYCGVTTSKHGRRNGLPSIDIRNSSFNFGIMCALIGNMAVGTNVSFRNVYTESLWMIGTFSGPGEWQGSVGFSECDFRFDLWQNGGRGIPASPFVNTLGASTFTGCRFTFVLPTPGTPMPNIVHFNCRAFTTSFINCQIIAGMDATKLYEKVAINATRSLVVGSCETNLADISWHTTYVYNLSTGNNIATNGGHRFHESSCPYRREVGIPVYAKHLYSTSTGDFDYGIPIPRVTFVFGKTTMTSVSQSGRTVTVNMTGSTTALVCATMGGDVGDVMYDDTTGTVFIVAARTGVTIDMVAQNNLDGSGNLIPTISLASGNLWTLNCRMFALQFPHYGDISSSSATISNVVGADGVSRNVDSATIGVQAGDYAIGGAGTAIGVASPTNSLISSVTSNSIVLTGNARYTATRERLTLFVRAATANNT